MRIPELQRILLEAARRQECSRRGWLRPGGRQLALVVAVVLGGATAALAAAGVFRTGTPVPASTAPEARLLAGGTWELLGVRTPDPDGGPRWAIRLVYYRRAAPYGPALCTQFGRIVDGRFGVLGEDGLFNDDGLFHPADIASYGADGCSGATPAPAALSFSHLTYTSGSAEAAASGAANDNLGCSQVKARFADETSFEAYARRWARQLAATIAVLRSRDAAARAMARRYGVSIANLVSADRGWLELADAERGDRLLTQWTYATCPSGSLRTLYWGYAGPQASSMAIIGHGLHETEAVSAADDGAYLFVLAGPPSRWYGERTRVTCRNGSHTWGCVAPRLCNPDQQPTHGLSRATPGQTALSSLAVLRQPAIAADTPPTRALHLLRADPFLVLVSYIRFARAAFGERFYLVPTIAVGCEPHASSEHVSLLTLSNDGAAFGGGPSVAQINDGEGIAGAQGAPIEGTPFVSGTRAIVEMIVPDGVAAVTLHYPAGPANGYKHNVLAAFTTTVKAINNVALAVVPRGGSQASEPATVVWRAASGRIVKTIHPGPRPADPTAL